VPISKQDFERLRRQVGTWAIPIGNGGPLSASLADDGVVVLSDSDGRQVVLMNEEVFRHIREDSERVLYKHHPNASAHDVAKALGHDVSFLESDDDGYFDEP
jgi:hypothetical protein